MHTNAVSPSSPQTAYSRLLGRLSALKSVLVAFSGGVDSTFLLAAAREALGDRILAATVATPYIPRWEIAAARELAASLGVAHRVFQRPFPERLRDNPPDHCYICKKALFAFLVRTAEEMGLARVVEGTNADDPNDFRPGLAALRELDICSPLLETGLTKALIRDLSRGLGLPTWDKPAYACLLSRIPVDTPVTDADLLRIEKAEVFLMELGFRAVRVRSHGDVARIEVPRERVGELVAADRAHDIRGRLKRMGFRHVAVDLGGYRTGSMNADALQDVLSGAHSS